MPESKGRPGSAGQRPTGGDKAVATQKKQYFRRKKVCRFCVEKMDDINYKDTKTLHAFVAERGKIVPRRISGVCAPHQRRLELHHGVPRHGHDVGPPLAGSRDHHHRPRLQQAIDFGQGKGFLHRRGTSIPRRIDI